MSEQETQPDRKRERQRESARGCHSMQSFGFCRVCPGLSSRPPGRLSHVPGDAYRGEGRAGVLDVKVETVTRGEQRLKGRHVVLISLTLPRPTREDRGLTGDEGGCARFRPSTSFSANHCLASLARKRRGTGNGEQRTWEPSNPCFSAGEEKQACCPTTAGPYTTFHPFQARRHRPLQNPLSFVGLFIGFQPAQGILFAC
ncbi:hypothetical protein QBC39DRAFT_111531 [Podospora conica]|nr:hypothetical protein QBC39DRAFT_111531 [Schizothecium conicum]